ncbi:MAG: GNAT family N-acetyltransferase [Candidatus Poseidoniales archaeon]|nr:MAG: GNAT family N-acetyltransferase [Candidatus Poseidoniales archaeon]
MASIDSIPYSANEFDCRHYGCEQIMQCRPLSEVDVASIWAINEEGLPGTGKVSENEIIKLLEYAELSLGFFDQESLLGFVICLPPGTSYGSLNYAWFNNRYDDFLYVDRVAVSTLHRNSKIGTKLYSEVISFAQERGVPVVAEVNRTPPNPGSMRFHERCGFSEVGVFSHQEKSVTMLLRG